MADTVLLGLFDNIDATADAIDDVRALGIDDQYIDVMTNTPYASKIFGLKPARVFFLPFVFGGAAMGAFLAWILTFLTPEWYPLTVGGQELTPVPPTVIIFFELIALFSMLGAFVGFLLQTRLPILVRQMYDPRITDGLIGLQVAAVSAEQAERVGEVFTGRQAVDVLREDPANLKPQGMLHLRFWGAVGAGGAVAMLLPLLLSYEIIDVPWISTMSDTVRVGFQEGPRYPMPDGAIPVEGPVMIAGEPATAPQPATSISVERGEALYNIYCVVCHGPEYDGNGLVGRYFSETGRMPGLANERVPGLPNEVLFDWITNGVNNRMPGLGEQLTVAETWDVINFLRTLGPASS